MFELLKQIPESERQAFLELVAAESETSAASRTGDDASLPELPTFSGGTWRGGALGRDEVYADECARLLPDLRDPPAGGGRRKE